MGQDQRVELGAELFLNALPLPAAVFDDDGDVVDCNAAWADRDDLVVDLRAGHSRRRSSMSSTVPLHRLVHDVLRTGRASSLDYAAHRPGHPRWHRLMARPMDAIHTLVLHQDITAEMLHRRRAADTQLLVLELAEDGDLRWASDGWLTMRGRRIDDELGVGWLDDTPQRHVRDVLQRLERSSRFVVERVTTTRADGTQVVMQLSFTPDVLEDGTRNGWRAVAVDLTTVDAMIKLAQSASIDVLTGFQNRSRMLQWIQSSVNSLGLLYIDLDDFKQINDRWGHLTGDEMIRAAAERLRTAVRPDDLLCRPGGDEFVIVAHAGDEVGGLVQMAERIIQAFEDPLALNRTGELAVQQSLSIGVALRRCDEAPLSLIGRADAAMYRAKQSPGSTFAVAE